MAELATKYLGINLRNPIIIGSSGLTENLEGLKNLEKSGAGAVVLKSLFEEQIQMDSDQDRNEVKKNYMIYSEHSETFDYLDTHHHQAALNDYLELIHQAKKDLMMPVIASINCITPTEWVPFAKKIGEAGADALELNIAFQTTISSKSTAEIEKLHSDIIAKVKKEISIPIAVKISPAFTNFSIMARNLSDCGANALVLFNRFFSPDINIEKLEITPAQMYSSPNDYINSLRWIAVLSGKIKSDLCASTGIHSGETVIKQLLAGASAVQITSAVYKNGEKVINQILKTLEDWMGKKGFNYIDQFKGKMSQLNSKSPEQFERIQFMKYFSQIK
jgi:dihydroorotate dehydrogenase (fumarate)